MALRRWAAGSPASCRKRTDAIGIIAAFAELAADAFIAVDDAAHAELAGRMKEDGASARLVAQRFLPLALAKELGVRRIIIVDTVDEEAARHRLMAALTAAEFPKSIIATLEPSSTRKREIPRGDRRRRRGRRPGDVGADDRHFALWQRRLSVSLSNPNATVGERKFTVAVLMRMATRDRSRSTSILLESANGRGRREAAGEIEGRANRQTAEDAGR